MTTSRAWQLVSRPTGMPTAQNFALVNVDLPPLAAGEVLVRNTFMSVDPYMRGRMNAGPSYVPAFEIGKALEGGAVGIVESSNDPALATGQTVLHALGWRDYAVGPAKAFRAIDATGVPASAYLGVLGITGFSAWVGLNVIDTVKPTDTVFVSSAAGAVGTVAGQLAKRAGARVIGSTRSSASAAALRTKLGFDDVIVVEPGAVAQQLRVAAPTGIDLFFDNVGGEQLEAAIGALNDFGRVVVCGMIANYNEPVPGPRNVGLVVPKRLTLHGFIVSDHSARNADFLRDVAPEVAAGRIVGLESFVAGLERAPEALLSLFAPGAHLGKLIVQL